VIASRCRYSYCRKDRFGLGLAVYNRGHRYLANSQQNHNSNGVLRVCCKAYGLYTTFNINELCWRERTRVVLPAVCHMEISLRNSRLSKIDNDSIWNSRRTVMGSCSKWDQNDGQHCSAVLTARSLHVSYAVLVKASDVFAESADALNYRNAVATTAQGLL